MTGSKIPYSKVCNYCNKEYIARKRTTKYCSHTCNSRAYKQSKRLADASKFNDEQLQNSLLRRIEEALTRLERVIEALPQQYQRLDKEILTIEECAEILGCSIKTIRRHISDKTIDVIRVGRNIQIHRNQLYKLKK